MIYEKDEADQIDLRMFNRMLRPPQLLVGLKGEDTSNRGISPIRAILSDWQASKLIEGTVAEIIADRRRFHYQLLLEKKDEIMYEIFYGKQA